jgi:hypothetical protein
MVAQNINDPGSSFGMTQHTPHHIGMTLSPAPLVLFYFPSINYVTHKIQSVTGIVFQKIIECFGLAILSA